MHMPPELIGALAAAMVGGIIKLARVAFAGVTDARASEDFKRELRGELASFETRLLERLGHEFLRSDRAEDRFGSIEKAIHQEAAERMKLSDRLASRGASSAAG